MNAFSTDFTYYGISTTPAAFKDGNDIKGYYAEILQRVGEELGQGDIKVNLAAYPRIFHALNENTSGFVLTCLFPNAKFNDKIHQPIKVAHFKTGIISMSGKPFTWDNYSGKNVATVKGASAVYGAKFHDLVESGDIKITSVTDYDQAMKMLQAGRIDGFAGNLGPMIKEVKKDGLDIAEPAVITEKISMITISAAPGTPNIDETVAKVKMIVEGMLASGEIQDIIEKYLPDEVQPR